ncbi:MAG: hypothetical protein A3F17_00945 [Gammaproteobacteria bacterium RIFCSPHIGHO2_12_FULL_41_15]|nr:MAG: hypothetical protein A3F17_00945 [Gammaproteobacteria bacterium RIFCSPHIGHO2_12_FULL_41_15]
MGRQKTIILPKLQRILNQLGENIRLARLRRQFPTAIVAERAGISRNTLRAIEQGSAQVTFGAYANVLSCLGLEQDLLCIANDDELGRKLQDANLPTRARSMRVNRTDSKKINNEEK